MCTTVAYVLQYEASQGRRAIDVRGQRAPADIDGDRVIEVKAFGGRARGEDLWLEARQVAEAETNPDFWVYVVVNVRQGDPQQFGLLMLGGEQLARLLARKRAQTYFSVPFPVAEYDAAPRRRSG